MYEVRKLLSNSTPAPYESSDYEVVARRLHDFRYAAELADQCGGYVYHPHIERITVPMQTLFADKFHDLADGVAEVTYAIWRRIITN